jgi:hypothetical protein
VFLGSTAGAANCLAGFRSQGFTSFPRLLILLDKISARPSFFFILLAAVLRITTNISKSLPDRWNDIFRPYSDRIARERKAFSLAIFASVQTGERRIGSHLFAKAQKNIVNGSISEQRGINPEHGQGQRARQKGSAMHWLF